MFRRIFSNRDNAVRAASRDLQEGAPAESSGEPSRRSLRRQPHSLQLKLADLRIGNEPDHALVDVPAMREANIDPLRPPSDAATAQLRGREYLTYISTDIRLGPCFKSFIKGDRVLRDRNLTDEKAQTLAEQFRPIVEQAYHDTDLVRRMDACALETTGYCSGRAQVFVGQMRDAALLSHVKSGQIDDVTLYNIGVSFFKLDAVRSEVGKRSPEHAHQQNVHDYLDAEYFLQDELKLPTRHTAPDFLNQGIIDREVAQEIGDAVKARMTRNNGENVIEFMSTWVPWQEHVTSLPKNRADYEKLSLNYANKLETMQADRETPGSYMAALSDQAYIEDVDAVATARADWINQFTGQKTFEFLANHKAEFLVAEGNMPRFFNRFTQ